MNILLDLIGHKEVVDRFKNVNKYAPGALKNAVRKAAALQARAIKAGLKTGGTGLLAKSIGSKVSERPRKGLVIGVAGPRRGFKTTITLAGAKKLTGLRDAKEGPKKIVLKNARGLKAGDVTSATRYAHLADDSHRHVPGGGRTKGQKFMKRAMESTKSQASEIVREAMAALAAKAKGS